MKTRTASENSSEVSLFPFLAVLLCTMGALLVLLVVMAQQVGKKVAVQELSSEPVRVVPDSEPLISAIRTVEPQASFKEPASSEPPASSEEIEEAEELARQLAEVRKYQDKLEENHEQFSQRLSDEKLRLSHLEEHSRRLEVELAKLSLASRQLEATEENQNVDQQQAELEQQRLKQQIQEMEATLNEMQEDATGEKSFAIVPYKGPNGTFRQPIFVECTQEGILLQPEGIQLNPEDFISPDDLGNPLAAALRAAREYLNAKAVQSGQSIPPDPYPLIVVRPDGLNNYYLARRAITSWDADFGYVFVKQDLPLEFPAIDSQLATVEHHAVMQAREMQQRLARAAPSRYRGRGLGGKLSSRASRGSQSYGSTESSGTGGGDNRYGTSAGTASAGSGQGGEQFANSGEVNFGSAAENGLAGSASGTGENGGASGNDRRGATGGENYGTETGGAASHGTDYQEAFAEGGNGEHADGEEGGNGPGGSGGQDGSGSQMAQAGGQSGSQSGSSSGGGSSGSSGTASSGVGTSAGTPTQAASASASDPSGNPRKKAQSIATTQGVDWAVRRKSLGSVPIRRSIRVLIRKDRLAILPGQRLENTVKVDGTVVLLNQPTKNISDELAKALREEIDEWGLAGNGLHWRPVLVLQVGPDAEQTAVRLMQLLRNSGVEIQSPEMARHQRGGSARATR